MRLANQVAVITGAGRGIGRAAARAFAREGARVVLAELDPELGAAAAAELCGAGHEAVFVRTDCSCSAAVQALMAHCEARYGRLDTLYNNASVFLADLDGPVTELSEATWARVLAVNLNSVFLCCRFAIPLLRRAGGGAIINTGSSASVMGVPGCDAYTAAKGATVALTRSLAVEYGPEHIRVNCICPAGIDTPMVRASSLDNPEFDAEAFFGRAPLGRLGTAEEVANLAVFLASGECPYMTGAILRCDGGTTVTPIS